MPFIAPNYALELAICDYFVSQTAASGSLLSGSNATFYTGIGNVDLDVAPAVVVDASDMVEIAPYTRNYTFSVNIFVKEIAADTNILGELAQAVFNECVDNVTAQVNFSNPSYHINVWNVRDAMMRPSYEGDALINQITVTMEGALVP